MELDQARLAAWLDGVCGDSASIEVERLVGGASNEVFRVQRGSGDWVLRRPPAHLNHASAHDVLREYRFLNALKDQSVRVPRVVAACDDPSVMGSSFYVMERVDGEPIRQELPAAYWGQARHHGRVGLELMEALAEVHAVDYVEVGLQDVGKPEGFVERQAPRWLKQWSSYKVRDLPLALEVGDWLANHLPPSQAPAIVHGDYKLDNVLYSRDLPPRILAVVDWEMATLGDPLLAVAWALLFWPEAGESVSTLGGGGQARGLSLDGLPTRADLAAHYAQRSGRDLGALTYYTALAAFKLAIVLEGNYARYVKGLSNNPMHPLFEKLVPELLQRASDACQG